MTPAHSTKRGKRYRYYTCTNAQRNGWGKCTTKSGPAGAVEGVVVEQIKRIGHDPDLVAATVEQARQVTDQRRGELAAELADLNATAKIWTQEIQTLVAEIGRNSSNIQATDRVADLQERLAPLERRRFEIAAEHESIGTDLTAADVSEALAAFDPIWEAMAPQEQSKVLQQLIERIEYDGAGGNVTIAFHALGIRTLMDQANEEAA